MFIHMLFYISLSYSKTCFYKFFFLARQFCYQMRRKLCVDINELWRTLLKIFLIIIHYVLFCFRTGKSFTSFFWYYRELWYFFECIFNSSLIHLNNELKLKWKERKRELNGILWWLPFLICLCCSCWNQIKNLFDAFYKRLMYFDNINKQTSEHPDYNNYVDNW